MPNNETDFKKVLPEWMMEKDEKPDIIGKGSNTGFLRKTLLSISKTIQDDLVTEINSRKKGLMQGLDARVKFITMLFFMAYAGASRSFLVLIFLAFTAVMLVKLSKLETAHYIKRVWLVIPFILLIASIPAATSFFIKGSPLLYIYRRADLRIMNFAFPQELYFSREGAAAVVKMALRVGVSISFAYLLILTTGWSQLTKALRVLRVPKLFITVLDMTYRYIFVLARIVVDAFEARFSRTVGKISNRENRSFIAGNIAFLFVKSNFMSEEIYDAMQCRGYTGEPVSMRRFKLSGREIVWILNMSVVALILMMGEILVG